MTLFIEASALVAIIRKEAGAALYSEARDQGSPRLTNGIALWAAARAIAKAARCPMTESYAELRRFCRDFAIEAAPAGSREAEEAAKAHDRYGKGNHPARLNMGDCCAYARARTNGATLLNKGGDFAQTDLA